MERVLTTLRLTKTQDKCQSLRDRGALDGIDLATAAAGFTEIRDQVLSRVRTFLSVPEDDTTVGVHPSDLTREHLREILRMFIATQPGIYPVPFNRLSTGALNILVFALLTYIADLRGPNSAIFAMEEPEIALPPHTQRRLVDFAISTISRTAGDGRTLRLPAPSSPVKIWINEHGWPSGRHSGRIGG